MSYAWNTLSTINIDIENDISVKGNSGTVGDIIYLFFPLNSENLLH